MNLSVVLITLGVLFLVGLVADQLGRSVHVPRVTLLLLCGIVVGGAGLDLIPAEVQALYDILSVTALTMVAFILGSALTRKNLAKHGRAILLVSVAIVVITLSVVSLGLWLAGMPAPVAILMGAIATATAPAATQDAIQQSGAKGPFVDLIKGIVAVDDAWGLLAFSLAAAAAHSLNGAAHTGLLFEAFWEIGGAVLLGSAIGMPAAYLTGRLKKGEPMQTEALGIVFLTAGLSIWLEVSFLIAGMTAGMIIANLARHHGRAFHEIEHIQWPFMLLFFILAGASLELGLLAEAGLFGAAYILFRIVSRLAGGWVGGALAGSNPVHRRWYGPALMPQAGVAVGMALVAAREFPEAGDLILTLTIGTTVFFELIGPAATLFAIRQVEKAESETG